jgi:predicted amidohydrolase YtcJ
VALGVQALALDMRLSTFVVDAPPLHSVERGLRALEAIHERVPLTGRRCVAMHLGRATDDQLRRLRRLGVVVTMVPAFLYQHAAAFALDEDGVEPLPIMRLLDAGVDVALASDNVPASMLFTAWQALARVDRRSGEGREIVGVDRETILRLCCRTGHLLNFEEQIRGVLAAGRAAEFIVLDGDPLGCPLDDLPSLQVDLTVLDGDVVHDRHGEAAP